MSGTAWVRIVYGPHKQYFASLVGKTVGEVRDYVRPVVAIPEGAVAKIHRRPIGDGHVLRAGQTVRFVLREGEAND